jgi:hypothetical protein
VSAVSDPEKKPDKINSSKMAPEVIQKAVSIDEVRSSIRLNPSLPSVMKVERCAIKGRRSEVAQSGKQSGMDEQRFSAFIENI